MKQVKILQSIAGNPDPRYNLNTVWSFAPGDTPTLHKDLADAWIASGIAAEIKKEK